MAKIFAYAQRWGAGQEEKGHTKGIPSNDSSHQNKFGVTWQLTNRVRRFGHPTRLTSYSVSQSLRAMRKHGPRRHNFTMSFRLLARVMTARQTRAKKKARFLSLDFSHTRRKIVFLSSSSVDFITGSFMQIAPTVEGNDMVSLSRTLGDQYRANWPAQGCLSVSWQSFSGPFIKDAPSTSLSMEFDFVRWFLPKGIVRDLFVVVGHPA